MLDRHTCRSKRLTWPKSRQYPRCCRLPQTPMPWRSHTLGAGIADLDPRGVVYQTVSLLHTVLLHMKMFTGRSPAGERAFVQGGRFSLCVQQQH